MPLITSSSYIPPRYLFNGHLQTIIPALFRNVKGLKYQRERITTPDEDFLDLDWSGPESKKLVIISHGLEGDSQRPYVKGMARAFNSAGWRALAWNFRGCSGEINKNLRFYHSGATDDLDLVIRHALIQTPFEQLVLLGFSLGGNLTLKYLGEQGNSMHPTIKRAVVFSVPLDLHSSSLQISRASNFIYNRRFLKNLKRKLVSKGALRPDEISLEGYKNIKTLLDFDDKYTAPIHGFNDALHYYDSCSAINFLDRITIPTLIVNAKNDPFLSEACYPVDQLKTHPAVYFENPDEGGHCGFLSRKDRLIYWSERRALDFAGSS